MVKSESEDEFQSTMDLAFQRLYNQVPRNGDLESKLIDFVEKRHMYESHLLAQIPGNCGLHWNACSKQITGVLYTTLIQVSQKEGIRTLSIQ